MKYAVPNTATKRKGEEGGFTIRGKEWKKQGKPREIVLVNLNTNGFGSVAYLFTKHIMWFDGGRSNMCCQRNCNTSETVRGRLT